MGRGLGQADMDLRNKWRAGVEDDETNLGTVTVSAGDARDGRKHSPNVCWKISPETRSETSAIDLWSYERRLRRRVVLLKSAHRGLRRHIYRSRVWKSFGISYFRILNKSFSVPK